MEKTYNLKFHGIEIAEKSLKALPTVPVDETPNFNFDITANSNLDAERKLIVIFLTINIKSANTDYFTAKLSISFGFQVINFEDLPTNELKEYAIPIGLESKLTDISISTARGILFSEFRGTYLHNAILPIVLSTSLQRSNEEKK